MKELNNLKNIMIQEDIAKKNQQERFGELNRKVT